MTKIALLIGVSEYESGLTALPSAVNDTIALQQVLVNPEMGGFAEADVRVLQNPDRQTMEAAIYTLFVDRKKDDLVLLYFSGHGVVNDGAEFFLTTRSTRKDQLPITAVAARSVQTWMEQSRCQRQVVILDSCFSGAFAKGAQAKDSGSVNVENFLGGKGRAILTASTSTQYAIAQEGMDLSVYTHYLVEGIRTGGADLDDDGWIAVEKLHDYAREKVQESAPAMTPEFYPVKEGYKIVLAKSPKDDPQLKYRKEVEQRAHQGNFSIPARRLLNSLRQKLGLAAEVAAEIEAEVLKPYRDFQHKLQEYEQTLVEALAAENPLSDRTRLDLQDYQQHLALTDEDVAAIAAKHLDQLLEIISEDLAPIPKSDLRLQMLEIDVITVNEHGKERKRDRTHVEYFVEDLGDGITIDMVAIPAGEFLMGTADSDRETIIQERIRHGASKENAEKWTNSEMPQHRVKVPEFWMGRVGVTQDQWKVVASWPKVKIDLKADPSNFKGAKLPVEQVSWEEAIEFCDRLSRQTGITYRLPSEAEWEYACRAGTTTPFHFGPAITPDLANYNGNYPYGKAAKGKYREKTIEVGTFPPNGFGLYDMHGNVWEWCSDRWHDTYQDAPTDGTAWTTGGDDNLRLLRGGSWFTYAVNCRSAHRNGSGLDARDNDVGFRLVCGAPRTL